jgi:hypothetical protein
VEEMRTHVSTKKHETDALQRVVDERRQRSAGNKLNGDKDGQWGIRERA